MHTSSSGVIFHDGWGDCLSRFGLLVQKGLSQQEHEDESCCSSRCPPGRLQKHWLALITASVHSLQIVAFSSALFINSDGLLPCFCGRVVFCQFVCQMMFV